MMYYFIYFIFLQQRSAVESSPNLASSTTSLDQSANRKKWTNTNAPLFPGYDDDDTPARNTLPKELATQDIQPAFQPPVEPYDTPVRKVSKCV